MSQNLNPRHLSCSIRQFALRSLLSGIAASIGLLVHPLPLSAQTGNKAAPPKKASPAAKAPAAKAAAPIKTAEKPAPGKTAEPATPAQAAKVLDLRTFPVMAGASFSSDKTLAMLMYEVKSDAKAAFEFQKKELVKRGFKEQPGGYADAMNLSGHFTKEGFHVAVSSTAYSSDPKKMGFSSVSLMNDGNVDITKLPVPSGVKPFYPMPFNAAYTTDGKVADVAAACRKLLLAAGWEPYGQVPQIPGQPDSSMQYFKRNAIKLMSWVSTTEAEGKKTLIRYSTELLQADLPAPADIPDPEYTDFQKTLRYDAPQDKTDAIIAFYQERLTKAGWKATTDKPISDDRTKSQFIIYRNAEKEMLSLDLGQFTDIVRVSLKHRTAAEVAEEERLAKAAIEKQKAEEAARNVKVKVAVPLPEKAGELEKLKDNVFEFKVATGTCAAVLEGFRKHFLKAGWTEEEGTELKDNVGRMELKKDKATLSLSYFDIGIGDAEIKVSGSSNVVLSTTKPSDKPAADDETKKKSDDDTPGLPAGVEVPDDVKDLVNDALKGLKKKPAPKK